jgi:hypothetical protein
LISISLNTFHASSIDHRHRHRQDRGQAEQQDQVDLLRTRSEISFESELTAK